MERARLLRLRRQLGRQECWLRSACVARGLWHHPFFTAARHVAVYLPHGGEVDTSILVRKARESGKSLYLPVLAPGRSRRMWFLPWHAHTPMRPNRFGIPEPVGTPCHRLRAMQLDLILMPLVGFDRHGNRLGMGGGFYDASLAHRLHSKSWRRPHLVGLAYDFQELPVFEKQGWDVPMDAIATESGVIMASQPARGAKEGR